MFYGLDRVTAAHANDFPISFAFRALDPTDATSTFSGDLGFVDGEYPFPRVRGRRACAVGARMMFITSRVIGLRRARHYNALVSQPGALPCRARLIALLSSPP